ncbi:pleckstrin homology domain-containing family G member 4B isoform X2 [Antennarius striatus]|uniref:pleckstrin homology domain-containing family G member 4B isoform X2 n=1 Tax=Antennarius striatus TaxID=241820 RepID=UPI0035B39794
MDSESLDRCIQTTLSALYPPFQATSPTVLCQVLDVVESYYRGDGLRYLLHFLLPAKQFLVKLQKDACLQYRGFLFRHEGWPLCIHEKIVVQLCPLDQRLLHPGDFYLLVAPSPPPPPPPPRSRWAPPLSCPRLLLCSLSEGRRHAEQQEVSAVALRSLFSMAFLDSVNREREQRGASRLERCLLSVQGDVFRVPWEDLVYPQFNSRPRTSPKEAKKSPVKDESTFFNPDTSKQEVKPVPPSAKSDQSAASSGGEDSEGEYVELAELPLPRFSPQKGSLTQSISLQHRARTSTHTPHHTPATTHTPKPTSTHSPQEVAARSGPSFTPVEQDLRRDSSSSPLPPTSSSAAPPEVGETFRTDGRTSQEREGGTGSGPEPESPTEQRQEAEEEEERERQEVVTLDEEEEEEGEELEGSEGRLKEDLLIHTTEEVRSKETEVESEILEEEEDEDLEVEVEEEVQETVVKQSQESRQGRKETHKNDRKGEEEEEKERGGEKKEEKSDSRDSYSENCTQETQAEDFYSENTLQTHTEDWYSELSRIHTHSENSSFEDNTQQIHCDDSYCEINQTPTHTEDLIDFEDATPQTHSESSVSENPLHILPESFHFENTAQHTQPVDSCVENTDRTHTRSSYSEKTPPTHTEDSENSRLIQTQSDNSEIVQISTFSEDSYFEKPQQNYSVDSFCEYIQEKHIEDIFSEKPLEDLHSETVLTHSDDLDSENTQQKPTEDSYFENTREKISEDSYSETVPISTHFEDSYFENTQQKPTEDSYFENTQPTNCEEFIAPVTDPDSLWTKPGESEPGQEVHEETNKEEEEEEEEGSCCEEVGGGTSAELQTEGLSGLTASRPTEPELSASSSQLDQSAAYTLPPQLRPSSQLHHYSFYNVLLRSGAVCLPGTRDRSGRALLTASAANAVWSHPDCEAAELLHLLLYYTSTLRKEVRAKGVTVLVDARRAAPAPALFSALRSLQENTPGCIHSVLVLINKDSSVHVDKSAAYQVELLSSPKSLHKQVELQQLPAELGGSLSFSQSSWRVEQLTRQCENVIRLLRKTIDILQATPPPDTAQDAELLLSRDKAVIRSILEDSRLVQLQQEGGASLSRLRSVCASEDERVALEGVSTLYDEVDELLHRLVTLSNSRTEELRFVLEFKKLEQDFTEVSSWLKEVGEERLRRLEEPADSLELLSRKQEDFREFSTAAHERCTRGEALLRSLERWGDMSSADLHVYEVKVQAFWTQLQEFCQRVKTTGQKIERAVRLYRFLDQAYGWALEGLRHLAGVAMEDCTLPDKCQAVIGCLEEYRRQHPPIPDARFQEMKEAAAELQGGRSLQQWSFAWSKCQETKKMFDRKMEAAIRTRDSAHRQRSDSSLSSTLSLNNSSASSTSKSSASSRRMLSGLWSAHKSSSSFSSQKDPPSAPPPGASPLPPVTSTPLRPKHTPILQRLLRSSSSDEPSDPSGSFARLSFSSSSSSSSRRQQLRKTQSFDCPPPTPEVPRYGSCSRSHNEPVCRGNTGVFIRGLEVSSTEAADRTLSPRTAPHGWAGAAGRGPGTPGTPRGTADSRPRASKLRHVVEEMVTTEREYVRSLSYTILHYFPEMDRPDLPQDLRGKRSVVFGNLEKLLDFHSQFFLKELEACWRHPLRVPHCFLRHQEQFNLYALYSKNKPKSDALLANHGASFFRRKQVELGDKMDLSSYLLKPVQRMSKYALLLTDLIKEVGVAQEAELAALHAATDMVKFQLRHGNDLLAMDAIRDCDVNLKEQGQLIRQDEFTVWTGRRKCQRHVFLFEELVLFSKPRKVEGGLDVFIYKHSFKTADVGLTESAGDNGLRFEVWFRRRTSRNQTFILEAGAADVKRAWTADIACILWTQAARNKEMRLKEMVSMGIGNKPFLDIQPSDAAISDRAVHYIMKSRGARTRASIAVSAFDHAHPFKRGALTSDPPASGLSSSSLLGPLNLHMYSQSFPSPAAESSFGASCIEEDEQEHETSSQPSMTTESSGSSSHCLSGSTGSDSGCVSSHLQEAPDEPSRPSQCSASSCSSSPSHKKHLSSQFGPPVNAAPVVGPATVV